MLFQDTVFVYDCSCGDPRSRRLVPSMRWGWGRREGARRVMVGMEGSRGRGILNPKVWRAAGALGGGLEEVPVAVPSGAAV